MDKRSKIIQIARYLETGAYSQIRISKMVHVSKNQVSVIKEVMEKNKPDFPPNFYNYTLLTNASAMSYLGTS